MTNEKLINKYQVEKDFHEWLMGFPDNTKFNISIQWKNSICVQTGNKIKKINKNQVKFKE